MGGIPDLYLIVLDIQIYGFFRLPRDKDPGIISSMDQLEAEMPIHIGLPPEHRQG